MANNEEKFTPVDGNQAVAHVAFHTNEVIALYPITPSSNMGEWADVWAAEKKKNIWNTVPRIIEMQSEGGAAGAVHGSLQTGSLTTTFTASQGLLLMIPNMYKIAGELTPTVFHVSARTLATHALSIFGDHSDVMSCRSTGWAMLASNSVQEAGDLALIAQAATLESRVPFLHFFDGFRVSHEVSKVELPTLDQIRSMINEDAVIAHRSRALTPDEPKLRGTAQNPDVFFQAREACNTYYNACPDIVEKAMERFEQLTGRRYRPFEYHGAADATNVTVVMGSGAEVVRETVDYMNEQGDKVGMIVVRLYRPFDVKRFLAVVPATVQHLNVLDRTKEPGANGEPLYLDVVQALTEGLAEGWASFSKMPKLCAGRFGLSSKEFTPTMAKAVFDNARAAAPKKHFTVGIKDDVTGLSLDYDPNFRLAKKGVTAAMFYGLGSDGTVGANKNSIKIISDLTDNYAQGYFVYDSKKAGTVTTSHLRFGPQPIRSPYLIERANFVACHQPNFIERYDMLSSIREGGTFLLNTHYSENEIWDKLPSSMQKVMIERKVNFYIIDAYKVAEETHMGRLINTIMQTCFFAISGVLPREEAIAAIKKTIEKTYGRKGAEVVKQNLNAVDQTLAHLKQVQVPAQVSAKFDVVPSMVEGAPSFVKNVLGEIAAGRGESLPVSAFPADGTFPTATTQYEKRNLALKMPVWDKDICIQCGKCSLVCPHAAIRLSAYSKEHLANAPATLKHTDAKVKAWQGMAFTIQVSPEDCTGCGACESVCPAKSKANPDHKALVMQDQHVLRDAEKANWEFFANLPQVDRSTIKANTIREQQAQQPLFEFSGACAGCGETAYLKLLSQLYGDRAVIANATGCSSIYGANLPTTPWSKNKDGRGPAWANSLFEDNAEFGLGFRVSINKQREFATELLKASASQIGDNLVNAILETNQDEEMGIYKARGLVADLKKKLESLGTPEAKRLLAVADTLVRRSVWIVGGDGWAYDIGFGGLDHVLASGEDVNILVLDTEVYSNTGGQCSKATPFGAVARFAEGGKQIGKKDLGMIAMSYGNVYVASVSMGAKDAQVLKAFNEAESYKGTSIIIARSHCIAHGIDMSKGLSYQEAAVDAGKWMLYRYDPRLALEGKNPMQLDSKKPTMPVEEYLMMENRFRILTKNNPEEAKRLFKMSQLEADAQWAHYEFLAARASMTSAT
jgi:pyruvate-ferredoxin/flavodoxin oxidoreductase